LSETTRLSADVYSYATASIAQRFWGPRISDVFRKPEGELFPGAVPVLLALIGLVLGTAGRAAQGEAQTHDRRWWAGEAFYVLAWGHFAAAIAVIVFRRLTLDLWLFNVRLGDATQLLLRGVIAYASALWLAPARRLRAAAFMKSRGFFVLALLAALWLSLGPSPQVLGRPLDLASPYRFLWTHVPGFDGLRVPARFEMVVIFMLAALGAFGAAVIARWRHGTWALTVLALVFLFEAGASPFDVNGMSPVKGFNMPPAQLQPPRRAPAIYQAVSRLPANVVLADLPLGQTDYDVRAMFYSIDRWRPIVNGYSGYFPPHYGRVIVSLSEIPRHPDVSMAALHELGVTHVIVHEAAFLDSEGPDTSATLRAVGALEAFREGPDVLLALP
jgi:hypothetical protein